MTRIVLDEDGVRRLLARLAHPSAALEPIRDAEDLHEVDVDAELWNRLPETPLRLPHPLNQPHPEGRTRT